MTQFEQDVDGTLDVIQRLLEQPDPDQSPAQRIDDLYLVGRLAESLIAVGDEALQVQMFRCCSWARQDLFAITDDGRHLDEAIALLQLVAPVPDVAAELADMLRTRAGRTDSVEDLNAAARLLRDALAMPHSVEDAVPLKAFLGLVLAHRSDLTGDLTDLADAIRLLTDAEPEIPPTDPGRPEVLATLGHLHLRGHLAPRAPEVVTSADLDRGIELLRDAASYGRYVTTRLATALQQRFARDEDPADRDEAIAILESLCMDPEGDLDPSFLSDLGDLYVEKLQEEGTGESYDRAIACLRRAWHHEADEPGLLATQLVTAFGAVPEIPAADVAWFRDICTELVRTTDPAQQDPMWPGLLGLAIAEQAARSGDLDGCREAITALTVAVHTDTRVEGALPIYGALATMIVHANTGHWPHERWSSFRLLVTSLEEDGRLLRWLESRWDSVPAAAPVHPLFVAAAAMFGVPTGTWSDEASIARLREALDLATADTDLEAQVRFALGRVHADAARRSTRQADFEAGFELLLTALPRLSAPFDRATCASSLGILTHVAYSSGMGGRLPLAEADDILAAALRDTAVAPEPRAMLLVALGQVRSYRWAVDQREADMRSGVELHQQALRILPDDADLRVDVRFSLALMLIVRTTMTRNLDDLAAARDHLTAILPQATERGDDDWVNGPGVREVLEMTALLRANEGGVLTAEKARALEATVARLSAKKDRDAGETGELLLATSVGAKHQGDARTARSLIDAVASMETLPDSSPLQKTLASLRDMMRGAQHLLHHDMHGFHDQLAHITDRMREPDTVPEERTRLRFMIGAMLRVANTETGDPGVLDTAIGHLRQVYAEMLDGVEPFAMYAAEILSDMYWVRAGQGDSGRSIEAGFDALHHHGRQVLLHADLEHGAVKAGAIADQAHVLAHRCVATGRLERAVAAVESGRGLVMSGASAGAEVAATLRELGHETTASEWEHSLRSRPGVVAPTDLRSRVLGLLTATSAERRLLAPPALADIAAALRATGADALAYLVPGNAEHRGRAVVVSTGARVTAIPLPLLDTADGGVVARYLAVSAQRTAESEWVAALDELVDWAWRAMAGPVLDEIATWRLPATPHIVLVPCGSLGVVPWHAARDAAGATPRFAMQRAAFSYAASARQLCDVAARPMREPAADPVVVTDPTGQLSAARLEARYLYRHCYPDGLYLGLLPEEVPADGVGTPDEVLGELPGARAGGASMLHLACHAAGGATSAESYVDLFRSERLTVKDLLEHAGGRPPHAPGGLVVLAACRSDLADRDHDEAMTLATAFLACGSASVVGTRWEVDDRTSAVLMCLFHRYLTVDRMPPAHALRAAQLWTLDPARVLPPDIAAATGAGDRLEIPLTTWAAYTHQGR